MRKKRNILGFSFATLWLAITVVPIYYIIVTSIRPREEYYEANPLSLPLSPTLDAFVLVLQSDFIRYFMNSAVVTVASVFISVSLASLISYYVARSTTKTSKIVSRLFLFGIAIPVQATIIPVYYMMVQTGLYDTLWAIILPSAAFALPISVLILTNFFRDIPKALYESMQLDGATSLAMFLKLVLPLGRPALVTVAIYNAIQVWNGFLFPLVLTQSSEMRLLPLSLWAFQGQFSVNIPAVLAAVTLSVVPMILAYAVARRQLMAGLTAGFGK